MCRHGYIPNGYAVMFYLITLLIVLVSCSHVCASFVNYFYTSLDVIIHIICKWLSFNCWSILICVSVEFDAINVVVEFDVIIIYNYLVIEFSCSKSALWVTMGLWWVVKWKMEQEKDDETSTQNFALPSSFMNQYRSLHFFLTRYHIPNFTFLHIFTIKSCF